VPKKKAKLPLSKTHPKLAKEADGWSPKLYFYSDSIILRWKCKKGHTWKAKPASRTSKSLKTKTTGCPYCSGKLVISGSDDLKSLKPNLAKEANGWNPAKFSAGSNRRMDWKCKKGHTWKAVIYERAQRNSGCPYCKNTKVLPGFNDLLKKYPKIAKEAIGWDPAVVNPGSHKKMKWRCKKGHIWEMPIVARTGQNQGCSVCANKKIVSGVNDLASMFPEIAKQADGWNPSQIGSGSKKIVKWKCKEGHRWKTDVASMTARNHLCPYCSNHNLLSGFNDLATKFPELAKESYGWNPTTVHPGEITKKTWRCSYGHTWKATVNSRTGLDAGCPFCSGAKTWPGFNDLFTTNPEFAHEALGWDASKYSSGSAVKKKWKCQEGHTWTTAINIRKRSGCPTCAFSGFDPNLDAYLYFLFQETWLMYQIGITNDIHRRLSEHSKNHWEVIEIRGPLDGHLIKQWEAAILRMLKAKGADLSNSKIAGKFDGYSEAWSKSTFPVKSIKELMRLTEEFEEH
jgi:hypothetical protein